MTYAFLCTARCNLAVSRTGLGPLISIRDFGWIFSIGTLVHGVSFLISPTAWSAPNGLPDNHAG